MCLSHENLEARKTQDTLLFTIYSAIPLYTATSSRHGDTVAHRMTSMSYADQRLLSQLIYKVEGWMEGRGRQSRHNLMYAALC